MNLFSKKKLHIYIYIYIYIYIISEKLYVDIHILDIYEHECLNRYLWTGQKSTNIQK